MHTKGQAAPAFEQLSWEEHVLMEVTKITLTARTYIFDGLGSSNWQGAVT